MRKATVTVSVSPKTLFVLCALAALLVCPSSPFARQSAMSVFVDGVEAMEAGDNQRALELFRRAQEMQPDNPEFTYYEAIALTKVPGGRDKALEIFRSLLEQYPEEYRKAYFDISAVYVKENQREKALEVLEEAIANNPGDARARIEAGSVAKDLGRYALAIEYFEKASELNPDLAPTAQHMIAIVHMEREEFDLSAGLFQQVIRTFPAHPAARASEAALAALERLRRVRKPWYVQAQFGWGYDDNLTNQPLDPEPGVAYGDREDYFQNFYLGGGCRFLNEKTRRLGVGYALHHRGYQDSPENNILAHNPYVFGELDRRPLHLRARYDFTYYYTGGADRDVQDWGWYLTFAPDDDKLKTNQVTAALVVEEPHGMSTEFGAEFMNREYMDITPDANTWALGATQTFNLGGTGRSLRFGYKYFVEDSERKGFDFTFHEFTAGFFSPLFYGILADVSYAYVRTFYDENPTYWPGEREDTSHRATAQLTRSITDRVQGSVTYVFHYNDSNVAFSGVDRYEFRRNMVMGAISASF
ncbi:MAG: tetratricopeptide repeat protein [Deltaproteobacteria bacterium]|nr:tetratricopeptide repeat protein [Deltaproteobacteria bacterium]